jgi:ATP phosphoribosyltransferase
LPKGRLLGETAALLQRAGWELSGYHEGARFYHLKSRRFPDLLVKVFHEKDIPIQAAVGNYDLGICGLDWVEELLAKYPSSALAKVRTLGYGGGALYVIAGRSGKETTLVGLQASRDTIRIASEYPNLAEAFALHSRLKRFSVFPLWGGAEVYPPESADLALVYGREETDSFDYGLVPVARVCSFSASLIVNKNSWERKDLGDILASIEENVPVEEKRQAAGPVTTATTFNRNPSDGEDGDVVWLALPDGHQQQPTITLLNKAGIQVDDYPSTGGNRRPTSNLEGVRIKVIRPQDMPAQVANGNFDLAITGTDWLTDHLYQFPSSPVFPLLDLGYGKVRIVAVVSNGLPACDIRSLKQGGANHAEFRVASEYVNIADKYARDNHLGVYKVIPTWGATEAFLPDDADLLIENTETGQTIARHNLKIIDTLFESAACLVGNKNSASGARGERIRSITQTLGRALT